MRVGRSTNIFILESSFITYRGCNRRQGSGVNFFDQDANCID